MPAGVINTHEDSDDDEAFTGEQKEIAKEMEALRAANWWINQEGWNAMGEGFAVGRTGEEINLRLDWDDVRQKLSRGTGGCGDAARGASTRKSCSRITLWTSSTPRSAFSPTACWPGSQTLSAYTRTCARRGSGAVYRSCVRGWAALRAAASQRP